MAEESAQLQLPEPEKRKKRGRWRAPALLAVFGAFGCAAAYAAWMYYSVQTPSALLENGLLTLESKIPAQITEVLVKKNERVQAGQTLVRFGSRAQTSNIAEIRAQAAAVRNLLPPPAGSMEEVERRVADAQTAEQSLVNRIMQARAQEEEATRNVHGKAEEYARAQLELRRLDLLSRQYSIPAAQYEKARSDESNTRRELEKARAAREEYSRVRAVADGDLYRIKAELEGLKAASGQARATAAHATRESTAFPPQEPSAPDSTDLVAPVDAVVADISAQPGAWTQANQQLVSLMPDSGSMEATAWFSENDGAALQAGQICRVFIMDMPEKSFSGKVEHVLPAGSLPPKYPLTASVRERQVPARIRFSVKDAGAYAKLKPGMRAAVRVHKFTPPWMRNGPPRKQRDRR